MGGVAWSGVGNFQNYLGDKANTEIPDAKLSKPGKYHF